MAFSKIILNGATLMDLTQDSVDASNLMSPHTAHNAAGLQIVGSASGSASDDFIVTVSYNSTTEMYEPNKTFAEVQAAYSNGKNIVITSDECLCLGSYDNEYSILYIEVYSDGYDIDYGLDSQGYQELNKAPLVYTQNANATASDVLDGVLAFGANGPIYGAIPRRTSSDIGVSDRTVTVTNGYYASNVSVNVATGTAGTPSATKGTVSNHQVSITPSVTNTTGYITGGTKTGTAVTVSASELVSGTLTVDSSGTKDVTNYASASIPAGTAGTPTATKGTVSNHQISVTPSVTNTTGWITGGTKTGTAVTVTASELASGNKAISANGTGIDVVGYSTVSVAVPGPNLQSKTGIVPTESSQTIQADSGYDGLSSVSVNAISSSYIGTGVTRRSSSDLTASGATVTAPAGYYAEAASKAVASGTEGTPTATKGTVSNHSVSVTPSVTNTAGYISGGTKTGTAVTVSASELASGNKAIAANGTDIDVVGYSTVSVAVPVVTYYTGSSNPSSSTGSNGDIYLKTN